MKIDLLEYDDGTIEGAPHISIVREDQLQHLMESFSKYWEIVPPAENDEYDCIRYPEYNHIGKPLPKGKPYIVWIVFRDFLSLDIVTIYFESINIKYIVDLMHTLYAHYPEAIEVIEAADMVGNRYWSAKNISKLSH